jgi:hypothetical protein
MKSLVEKKPSIHNQPGNHPSTSESQTTVGEQYSLPKPQQPKFSPLQAADAQTSINGSGTTPKVAKECIVCKKLIPMQAKFCSRCGNSQ